MEIIEIDVTSPSTRPREKFESLFDRTDLVVELIKERLEDSRLARDGGISEKEIFKKFRSPDTVVIDGRRGSGKTTHLMTLAQQLPERLKSYGFHVACLDIIDTTNLTKDVDILQLFLAKVHDFLREKVRYKIEKRGLFEEIATKIYEIVSLLRKIPYIKKDYFVEDDHTVMYTNYQIHELPFLIHLLGKRVCEFLDVDAVVFFIDDVDLNIKQSFEILEFLKNFFLTPYFIPVVALNMPQALTVVKKEHFDFYGLKVDGKLTESFEFLKDLPAEWLGKVLPPSRRVVLPDMFQIFEDYVKRRKPNGEIIYFIYRGKGDRKIKVEFSDVIKLFMAVIYEWFYLDERNGDIPYQIENALKGRSIRDFIHDVRALLMGIVLGEWEGQKGVVKYNREILKARFKPYSMYKQATKFDAIAWFWKSLKQVFEIRISSVDHISELRDIVREVTRVAEEDNEIIPYLRKTYYRILMQDFYVKELKIFLDRREDKEGRYYTLRKDGDSGALLVERTLDLKGLRFLVSRTLVPAYIFYFLVKEGLISNYREFDWGEFYPLYTLKDDEEVERFYARVAFWPQVYGRKEDEREKYAYIYLGNEREKDRKYSLFKWKDTILFSNLVERGIVSGEGPELLAIRYYFFNPFLHLFSSEPNKPSEIVEKAPYGTGISFLREVIKAYTRNVISGIKHFNRQYREVNNAFFRSKGRDKSESKNRGMWEKVRQRIVELKLVEGEGTTGYQIEEPERKIHSFFNFLLARGVARVVASSVFLFMAYYLSLYKKLGFNSGKIEDYSRLLVEGNFVGFRLLYEMNRFHLEWQGLSELMNSYPDKKVLEYYKGYLSSIVNAPEVMFNFYLDSENRGNKRYILGIEFERDEENKVVEIWKDIFRKAKMALKGLTSILEKCGLKSQIKKKETAEVALSFLLYKKLIEHGKKAEVGRFSEEFLMLIYNLNEFLKEWGMLSSNVSSEGSTKKSLAEKRSDSTIEEVEKFVKEALIMATFVKEKLDELDEENETDESELLPFEEN